MSKQKERKEKDNSKTPFFMKTTKISRQDRVAVLNVEKLQLFTFIVFSPFLLHLSHFLP